jgi:hypothetical protein
MNRVTNDFLSFTSRTGLYQVWMPLRNDRKAPLVSVWMDPAMTAFETRFHEESVPDSAASERTTAEETEEPNRCIAAAEIRTAIGNIRVECGAR